MKSIKFPIFKTKSLTGSPIFNLNDPRERAKYFQFKAGVEIAKLKDYLKTSTFLAIMLGKKAAGKGTYSKLFAEALGTDQTVHIAAGDIVREVDQVLKTGQGKKELVSFLEDNYRGYLSIEAGLKAISERKLDKVSTPDELMLALMKRKIDKHQGKALFIDGFPRTLGQISYSLFFRDLVGYRDDPDFFVLIDIPEKVIDERIKSRVVCPKCRTPRNLKLLPTKTVKYDPKKKAFYLVCDNPACRKVRMVGKEGDELGIGLIKKRLEVDEKLIEQAFGLYGIPKILLRNAVPVNQAEKLVDDYEITPEYVYAWDEEKKKVKITEKPWVFKDDRGIDSVSLLAPPVVVSLIKQLADLL